MTCWQKCKRTYSNHIYVSMQRKWQIWIVLFGFEEGNKQATTKTKKERRKKLKEKNCPCLPITGSNLANVYNRHRNRVNFCGTKVKQWRN